MKPFHRAKQRQSWVWGGGDGTGADTRKKTHTQRANNTGSVLRERETHELGV